MTDGAVREELDEYRKAWHGILEAFGWSPEQVDQWARPLLNEHAELTLHEPVAQWLAPALVPADLKARLDPPSLGRLYVEIQEALDQGDDFWRPGPDSELLRARGRVEEVFRYYRKGNRSDLAAG